DTLIIIPNQNLFRLANEKTTFTDAFAMADDVLYQGVKGVTDLMVRPGLINLDFADVRAVMDEMGKAMMGTGEASGEDRAVQAAEKAIANPLLDEISLKGAKGVLINITGGSDLTLFELDEAANRIREEVDPDANIIVGSTLDDSMEGLMRVSVVATGIDAAVAQTEVPTPRRRLAEPLQPVAITEPEPVHAPAPQPEPVRAVERPVAASAPEPRREERREVVAEREEERTLFDATSAGGDLPPPAYQPEPRHQPENLHVEDDPQSFVAPRPRTPGTPTPEALARLQAAVSRAPGQGQRQPAAPQPVQRAPQAAGDKPRFGINSLLNRMTGHAAEQPQRTTPTLRQTPPPQSAYDDDSEVDPDQERIEIPAFLRRQAN
ncbi:MAG: cell division protein FtsZ, partial [Albidovulum sp.]|uniref:cell division protein FtsZ n=1 Tax=Albidovulum sp. TaxID=1872424 RepID=UPI003C8C194B